MKKQIVKTAIVAATAMMATSAFAEINITGDAFWRHTSSTNTKAETNKSANEHQVRVTIVGKAGNTEIHARLRNNGRTRASNGKVMTDDNASAAGISRDINNTSDGSNIFGSTATMDNNSAALLVDYLFVTTQVKLGRKTLNLKAGDWYADAVGLGIANTSDGRVDAVKASMDINKNWSAAVVYIPGDTKDTSPRRITTIDPITGLTTAISADANDEKATGIVIIKGNIKGWKVTLENRGNSIAEAQGSKYQNISDDGTRKEEWYDNGYTDLTVQGDIKGYKLGVDLFFSKAKSFDDSSSTDPEQKANAYALMVDKKIKGINLKFAYVAWDNLNGIFHSNGDANPLDLSFIDNDGLSLVNAQKNYDPTKGTSLFGFAADFTKGKMTYKVALGDLDVNQNSAVYTGEASSADPDQAVRKTACETAQFCGEAGTFFDLQAIYDLGSGATLGGSYGSWAGESSMGAKISVDF